AIVGAEYVLRWLPKGTHRYSLLRKPDEVRALLEAGGLETTGATGVRVNPMTRLFSLTPGLDVNYMVFARKPAQQPPK
ncbi:MAG: bifunctional 3-demethylubiquinol 3-O-methyltransferase/2-polyprenyl-6-hydroxyphenol methylase, partial [Pseudomonadota bacterium]